MSKRRGRKPNARRQNDGKRCRYAAWKDGELVYCSKPAAARQLFCSREHAPFGMYDLDQKFLFGKKL